MKKVKALESLKDELFILAENEIYFIKGGGPHGLPNIDSSRWITFQQGGDKYFYFVVDHRQEDGSLKWGPYTY